MIKAKPEDFVVEEQAELPLVSDGDFRVYWLTKSGWNTLDLVRRLARNCGVSPDAISYGGKKDKHGLTGQFIAIRDRRDFSRAEGNFRLEARGSMRRPMGPDLVQGNDFRLTLRDLGETASVRAGLAAARVSGFPNFFDDQRFRSYDPERGFFAEKILRRHYNGALQVFFSSATPEMSAAERERRRALFEHWRDWEACLKLAANRGEREILAYLSAHPREFARALHKLPREEVSMRYSSFQSHLWNELLRRLIRLSLPDPGAVRGAEGDYLFWGGVEEGKLAAFRGLCLPTAAAHMEFADAGTAALFDEILKERGLKRSDFRPKVLRQVYFKSFQRRVLVVPSPAVAEGRAGLADPLVLEEGDDDLHRGRKKITIAFGLPRGSYATMLVKSLTLRKDLAAAADSG